MEVKAGTELRFELDVQWSKTRCVGACVVDFTGLYCAGGMLDVVFAVALVWFSFFLLDTG